MKKRRTLMPRMAMTDIAHPSSLILEYDAARKIAQGLSVHLEQLSTLVEIKGDKARLLPVAERTRVLFGKDGAAPAPKRTKKKKAQLNIGRDGRFWLLAQSLSALYPGRSDEKRWVDGVLARKKGLGF